MIGGCRRLHVTLNGSHISCCGNRDPLLLAGVDKHPLTYDKMQMLICLLQNLKITLGKNKRNKKRKRKRKRTKIIDIHILFIVTYLFSISLHKNL